MSWVSPYQCNIRADIEYNSGDHCDGDTLVKINWQNKWTSYNYQHSSAKSFRLPGSDWSYAECYLYSDENATGNILGTVYRMSGSSNCISLPNGASVKSAPRRRIRLHVLALALGLGTVDELDVGGINVLLHLGRQHEVEQHADDGGDGEARLHDEDDGAEEALQRVVVALVGEDVVKVLGHESRAVAQRQARRQDEARAAVEGGAADDNGHTGDGDGGEEEGGHAAEDGLGDGDEGSGELGEDAHDDEEEAAGDAGGAVGAAGEGDDAVVLGEAAHGRHGHEGGDDAVEPVGEQAALDARLVGAALDLEAREVAGGGDVADGLGRADDVDGDEGQDEGAVDGQGKGAHPDEGGDGGRVDARGVKVARGAGDDAADEQADDDRRRLHDGGAEALAEDDGDEGGEAEAEELGGAPGEGVRRVDVGAQGEEGGGLAGRGRVGAGAAAAHPVLEAALDEVDADEHDGRARDDGREHVEQYARRQERDEDLGERAHRRRADDGAVPVPAGERRARVRPLAYICRNAPSAMGMVEKEMPTTERTPVPMK
ncbi:hypothetical protein O9K51_09963 [Purpureocillium lavendulum]|uniref:Uncharacterized protein n=1 Tax=Purpureocillium lavendulum TaxID=1247861 RepID=A0AB34FED3_9HYPO|nr:hypothetical protein O9K51_09963 [Purpureocillium lavendulum]